MNERSTSRAPSMKHAARALFATQVAALALLGAGVARAQNAPNSAEAPPPPRPRWSTSMGSVTLDGASFTSVRASCGMFELLAFLGAASPAVRACPGGSVSLSIAGGAVTQATPASSDAASVCLANAVRAIRFGRVSCTVQFTAGR